MKVEIFTKSENSDGTIQEEAKLFIDAIDFQEERELNLKEGWYKKSIKIFQCEEAEKLTDVSLESIKMLAKKIRISAVLNCGERVFKEILKKNTNLTVKLTITEERRLLLYTYFEDKLLIYYDK